MQIKNLFLLFIILGVAFSYAPKKTCTEDSCIYETKKCVDHNNHETVCPDFDGERYEIFVPSAEDQHCYDVLSLLSSDSCSVDNWCDYDVVDDKLIYNFHIKYITPFVFDAKCLCQIIKFEDIIIPEGHAPTWEYTFDGFQINFSIPHLDLEKAGCTKFTDFDDYIWQCDMSLVICYKDIPQYKYLFCMQACLNRIYKNKLKLTVTQNYVLGNCCENILHIDTELNFCCDITCNSYLGNYLKIERKGIFYVEHKIVTEVFKYYYLHQVQLTLGKFYPTILQKISNQRGHIIYKLQANVAMNNMCLESIVRIDEVPEGSRRALASQGEENTNQVGDNYLVKATSQKIIIDGYEKTFDDRAIQDKELLAKEEQQLKENRQTARNYKAGIITISVFFGLYLMGMSVFIVKNRKQASIPL